jgi:hypothetical protein
MTEQTLIDLGFERFDEDHWGTGEEFYYYTLNIGGVEFITNANDEWNDDGIYVDILETDIRFKGSGDLEDIIRILEVNER